MTDQSMRLFRTTRRSDVGLFLITLDSAIPRQFGAVWNGPFRETSWYKSRLGIVLMFGHSRRVMCGLSCVGTEKDSVNRILCCHSRSRARFAYEYKRRAFIGNPS